MVRDGKSAAEVLKTERETRLPEIRPYLRPLSRQAARGVPTFLTGDFNSPSHLDWTPAVAAVRPQVKYPLRWPVSAALAGAGFRDSYREVHPDPVARPGLTWTAGTPPPRIRRARDARPDRLGDGERAGHDARQQAGRRAGRPGRGHRRAVGLRPPLGGVDVRRRRRRRRRRSRTPSRASCARGDPVLLRYIGARGTAKRIGILPAGGGRPLVSLPIADTSDHRAAYFGTAGLRPGAYRAGPAQPRPRARLVALLGAGPPRAPADPHVAARVPARPAVGLRWSGMPGNKFDWVGIYRATRPLDLYGYYGFSYLGALPARPPVDDDRRTPARLAPGRYVAGLFLDDGYALLARTSFRVKR